MLTGAMTDDAAPFPRPLPVVAFFDVDKTLVNGASAMFLARAARSLGIVGRKDLARFGWEAVKFRRHGERMSVLDEVRERALQLPVVTRQQWNKT